MRAYLISAWRCSARAVCRAEEHAESCCSNSSCGESGRDDAGGRSFLGSRGGTRFRSAAGRDVRAVARFGDLFRGVVSSDADDCWPVRCLFISQFPCDPVDGARCPQRGKPWRAKQTAASEIWCRRSILSLRRMTLQVKSFLEKRIRALALPIKGRERGRNTGEYVQGGLRPVGKHPIDRKACLCDDRDGRHGWARSSRPTPSASAGLHDQPAPISMHGRVPRSCFS